jgi:hypothetical protein
MRNERLRFTDPPGGSGGIEPMWHASFGQVDAFEWRRADQLEPLLERLRWRHGDAAVLGYGVACIQPLRKDHDRVPRILRAAKRGFGDPQQRARSRRSFGSAAGAALSIGMRNGMAGAAAFLAAVRLLDDGPVSAVAHACDLARVAHAFRQRERVLRLLPDRRTRQDRLVDPDAAECHAIEERLCHLLTIDPEDASRFIARAAKAGGDRTRLVLARIAAVEAEAIAWGDQLAMLESDTDFEEVIR